MPSSTQKCPPEHAVDIAIIKHPPPYSKYFLILFQRFVVNNPYINWNKITTVKTVQQWTLVAKQLFHNAPAKNFVILVNNHC